jgi:hypothetical protein
MKYLPYLLAGLLLLSCSAAISISKEADVETINLCFSKPDISESGPYIELNVEGANARLHHADKPMLPIYTTTMCFPFATKIVDIECEIGEVKSMVLPNKVVPAPKPVVLKGVVKNTPEYEMDETIYGSEELFPESWFCYYTGGGLDENNRHTTFLTLRVYPVRYSPARDTIYYVEKLDLTITYKTPRNPFPENSAYDMVIIAPSGFISDLQSLVEHKNNHGVDTILKPLEEIYTEYRGVDKPERIKYFIKDAIETMGIKYVLLVGGMKSPLWGRPRDDRNQGTKSWHLPVRYTNLRETGGLYDPGFISDLYYADIYDSEGNFSSWDSDGDGVFAEWKGFFKGDIIDLYPDVYVGRLACRNNYEVKIMVDKIINYETLSHGQSWFNKMIVVGGDTFEDPPGTNYIEGEVVCDYILDNYMSEFTPVKLYASYRYSNPEFIPSAENLVREISSGSGFLLFDGHGHPGSWNTHWPGVFNWKDTPGGITCYDFWKFTNSYKLPVCIVGGCHNSQFNITYLGTLLMRPFMWTHGYPFAECFSWMLTRNINGGTIATMGNTGLGYGATGNHGDLDGDGVDHPDAIEANGGYQEVLFFKTYDEGKDTLGEVWGGTLRKYLNTYPGMADIVDAKTVEQWPILGDPSLKIGGYAK